jgi:hypothetical protein
MTYLKLNSGAPLSGRPLVDYPQQRSPASAYLNAPQTAEVPPATDSREATNDDGRRLWYQIRNPLWVIVIGMAILFAVMALIVALG